MEPAVLIASITGAGGFLIAVLTAIVGYLTNRNVAKKDEVSALKETIMALTSENERIRKNADMAEQELANLKEWRDNWETYVDNLLVGIRVLHCQLENAKMTPDWKPGERPTLPNRKQKAVSQ